METTRTLLNDFKKLKTTKAELQSQLGSNLHAVSVDNPLVVKTEDMVHLLGAYKGHEISLDGLLDWVNTIWFTDLYEYAAQQQDSIASVMDVLEQLDEDGQTLTPVEIDTMIEALRKNVEYKWRGQT